MLHTVINWACLGTLLFASSTVASVAAPRAGSASRSSHVWSLGPRLAADQFWLGAMLDASAAPGPFAG